MQDLRLTQMSAELSASDVSQLPGVAEDLRPALHTTPQAGATLLPPSCSRHNAALEYLQESGIYLAGSSKGYLDVWSQ